MDSVIQSKVSGSKTCKVLREVIQGMGGVMWGKRVKKVKRHRCFL